MEAIFMFVIGAILLKWDKFDKNKQELEDFPVQDRRYSKKEIIKFLLVLLLHYCVLVFIFIILIELSNSILKLIGHGVDLSYEIRNYYARIASIIITVLRIPKLKRINLDNEK